MNIFQAKAIVYTSRHGNRQIRGRGKEGLRLGELEVAFSRIWILIGLREHRYYGTHCTIMFKKPNISAPTSISLGQSYVELCGSPSLKSSWGPRRSYFSSCRLASLEHFCTWHLSKMNLATQSFRWLVRCRQSLLR